MTLILTQQVVEDLIEELIRIEKQKDSIPELKERYRIMNMSDTEFEEFKIKYIGKIIDEMA